MVADLAPFLPSEHGFDGGIDIQHIGLLELGFSFVRRWLCSQASDFFSSILFTARRNESWGTILFIPKSSAATETSNGIPKWQS